jgi:hypothetical protein
MKFRDVAFCGSNCTNTVCRRYFTQAEKEKAGAWWKVRCGSNPPSWPLVAFADFSAECDMYRAPNKPPMLKTQIETLWRQGRTPEDIAYSVNRSRREVATVISRLKRGVKVS